VTADTAHGIRLGLACEALVLRVLSRPDRPPWIRKVRRARWQEDRSGIDIVVHCDVGRLFLQVKRSRHYLAAWLRRHATDPRPIGLVIARETEHEATVYGRALGALILLRERLELQTTTEART
jgi:hypothetical protein